MDVSMALEELQKSRNYHNRQLEDNLQKIKNHEESVELLKKSNEKHIKYLTQIDRLTAFIAEQDGSLNQPIEK